MAKYLFQGSYTEQGLKGVLQEGGSKRREAAEQLLKGMGGRLEAYYYAFGSNDFVIIADLPSNVDAAALSLAVNASGAVASRATVLITPEEVDQAAKKTVKYRPPGKALVFGPPQMNILLKSKRQVEAHFRKKATMASNLLDMVAEGEKAYGWLTGTMDAGWDVTVGFFNDKARYVRFKKRRGTRWTVGDLRAVWMQIGPLSNWQKSADDPDYFDYTEKQGDNVVAFATGWQTPPRTRAFVYVPDVPGEVGIVPDRTAVDQKP